MPHLSPSDLAAIYRACECLATKELFSEWYISIPAYTFNIIVNFYSADEWGSWSDDYDTRQNERIMALLFFAAAKGEL